MNCWAWIDELLALAGLAAGAKVDLRCRAAWMLGAAYEAAYRLLRLQGEPPMSRFLAAQMATSHYFNIARARRDFSYEAEDFDRRRNAPARRRGAEMSAGEEGQRNAGYA